MRPIDFMPGMRTRKEVILVLIWTCRIVQARTVRSIFYGSKTKVPTPINSTSIIFTGILTPLIQTFLFAMSVRLPRALIRPCFFKGIGLSPFRKSFHSIMDSNWTLVSLKIRSYTRNRRRGFMSKMAFARTDLHTRNTFKRAMFLLPAKVPYFN